MNGGGAAGDAARSRLAAEMIFRTPTPRERMDDVARHARRGPRPTDRAQWDEVHGCWVEWDDDERLWVHVGELGSRTPTNAPQPG